MLKTDDNKKITYRSIAMIVAFAVSYYLIRFSFYNLHQMKSWTNKLAIFGIIILIIAIMKGFRKLPIFTLFGYAGGFVLAMLFNSDGLDAGGARTNNAWEIWTIVFILSVVIGNLWEIINIKKNNKSN